MDSSPYERCESCGQPIQTSERRAREAIRTALSRAGITQAELATRVGVTQKHISQVLNGKSGLSFDFAEKCLAALDHQLRVSFIPLPPRVEGGEASV